MGRSVSQTTSSRVGSCFRREAGKCVDDRQHARLPTCRQLIMHKIHRPGLVGRVEHMPCEVSSRRWSCLHRCRECLSRSHLRCVQHDGPADKPPIGDLLPRLGSSIRPPGAKLVVYPNMAGERGWANAKGDCCCAFTAYCIVDSRRRGDNLHLHLRKAYTEGMLFGAALQYVQKGIEW